MLKKQKDKNQEKQLRKTAGICQGILSTLNSSSSVPEKDISQELLLNYNTPGVFFGSLDNLWKSQYVGMKQGCDGHILVVGGSGSGKSSCIAKPTLRTWSGPMCVTDINGELSDRYHQLYMLGYVTRPYIRFDPTDLEGPSYDPIRWLMQDGDENLISNIQEMVLALIPIQPEDKQPFWVETERSVLEAAILYFYPLGLSFPEITVKVMSMTTKELCEELAKSKDIRIQIILGEMSEMRDETLACVDRGLRNKLKLFATDPFIGHALRGKREGAKCFSWDDLDEYNIFLCIPEHFIAQWGPLIILMLAQFIRYSERRPNKHSTQGESIKQILLLLDEFPRFGKLEMIADAIATLRNKKVTISLLIQSLAQLDKIYGEHDRRIICENCLYKVILQAGDTETQEYISRLIGKHIRSSYGCSQQLDLDFESSGYNVQLNEVQEWRVQPNELATLNDIFLLTPHSFFRVKKFLPGHESQKSIRFTVADPAEWEAHLAIEQLKESKLNKKRNNGAKTITIRERTENAETRVEEAMKQLQLAEKRTEEEAQAQRRAERQAREKIEKRAQRNNFVIGKIVAQYLPAILGCEPEEQTESNGQLKILTMEETQKQRVADRQVREAQKEQVKRINYAIGKVAAWYFPQIIGFEPEEEIESGDCLKILKGILAELAENLDFVQKVQQKVTAEPCDYPVKLNAVLTELMNDPVFLKQLQKKATDIVIIENFFAEVKAKNETENADN